MIFGIIVTMKKIKVDKGVVFGGGKLAFIAGPCVIESRAMALDLAKRLVALSAKLGVDYVFKASFDKANRTSVDSYRGPGIEEGLDILAEIRQKFNVPVLTDVHEPWQCAKVAEVCDILQIPAFLARQTDLVVAAAETGAIVTAEEHNIIGGLGSAVAEVVTEECPVPVVRVGVKDEFGHSGKVPPLLEMYGLTPEKVAEAVKKAISLKK